MASAVGGARDGRGETPRTLETYPRHFRTRRCARTFPRTYLRPEARRRRRVRRDARQVARPRRRRATWEIRRGRVRGGRRGGDRVGEAKDEEERAAREDAAVAGENGGGASGGGGGEVPRTPPPPARRRRRPRGNRTRRATRWTRRRCAPRAKKAGGLRKRRYRGGVGGGVGGVFRARRGDAPPSKPAPESRGRGARRRVWRLKISNICSSATGPDTGVDAAANRRKAEAKAEALAAGEQAREPEGGQLDGASNAAPPAPRICTRAGSPCTSISARACCGCSISSGAVEAIRRHPRRPDGSRERRSRRLFSWTRRARWVSSAGPRWWWRRCRRCPTGRASSKRGVRFELRDVRRKPSVAEDTSNARVSAADDA